MLSSNPSGSPPEKPEDPDCCNDPDPQPMCASLDSETITGWVCANPDCREVLV